MKKLLLTICYVLISALSYAYDFEVNGIYYNLLTTSTVEVTKGDALYEGGIINIPESVQYSNKSFSVEQIGEYAFSSAKIESVSIPSTVKSIGQYAFNGSTITTITIPGSVENCYHAAFNSCSKLKDIHFEYSDKSLCFNQNLYYSEQSFRYCSSLENIYIDRYAYVYASNGSFRNKANSCYVFSALPSIKNVYIGSNVTSIGNWFSYCSGIEKVEIPSNITSIYDFAFRGCKNISELIFHDGDKNIYNDTFYACSSLKKIDFQGGSLNFYGSNTWEAEHAAFEECTNLETIIFPDDVVNIHNNTFKGCKNISKVYAKSASPTAISTTAFDAMTFLTATLFVPVGAKEKYESTEGWNQFSQIIEIDNFDISSEMHTIGLSVSNGGKVVCGTIDISNYSYSWSVEDNTSLTLQIIPNEGYIVKNVEINNEDVTNEVRNGILQLDGITSDKRIYVNFEKEETLISIKDAELGCVSLVAENGKSYTFVIAPCEGWIVESVSFNGEEVTSQLDGNRYTTPAITSDSELNIVYKQDESSAVKSIKSESNVKVSAAYGRLIVDNTGTSVNFSVYTTSGVKVASEIAGVGTTTMDLPTNNIYVVKVGEQTFKVSM